VPPNPGRSDATITIVSASPLQQAHLLTKFSGLSEETSISTRLATTDSQFSADCVRVSRPSSRCIVYLAEDINYLAGKLGALLCIV
jgi:hypothetical protein